MIQRNWRRYCYRAHQEVQIPAPLLVVKGDWRQLPCSAWSAIHYAFCPPNLDVESKESDEFWQLMGSYALLGQPPNRIYSVWEEMEIHSGPPVERDCCFSDQREQDDDDNVLVAECPAEAMWCMCLNVFPRLDGHDLLRAVHRMNLWRQGTQDAHERSYSTEWALLLEAFDGNREEVSSILTSAARCSLSEWQRFESSNC